jgi:hypothetical protein
MDNDEREDRRFCEVWEIEEAISRGRGVIRWIVELVGEREGR